GRGPVCRVLGYRRQPGEHAAAQSAELTHSERFTRRRRDRSSIEWPASCAIEKAFARRTPCRCDLQNSTLTPIYSRCREGAAVTPLSARQSALSADARRLRRSTTRRGQESDS